MTKPDRAQIEKNVATIIDTRDPACAAAEYAKHLPSWSEMSKDEQSEIVDMSVWFVSQPKPARTKIGRSAEGVPQLQCVEDEYPTVSMVRQLQVFATPSTELMQSRVADILGHFQANSNRNEESELNAGLAFVQGVKAEDPVQSTLAVQMVATHDAAMRALRMMGKDNPEQALAFGNLANKLLRTFTMQAETLGKLQRGGEQVIKHVHIDNRGGQAVVAETVVAGGQIPNGQDQPYATCTPLPGENPVRVAVPTGGGQG